MYHLIMYFYFEMSYPNTGRDLKLIIKYWKGVEERLKSESDTFWIEAFNIVRKAESDVIFDKLKGHFEQLPFLN